MTTVNHQLSHLETSGLVELAQTTPELEYFFRHALVQDAAYQSLLKADRRQFHLTIGKMLEQLYPERLDELAATLGQHFQLAEERAHALPYFIQAGDSAASIYANDEAITLYGKALAIACKIEVEQEILLHLCQTLGRTLEITSAYNRALTHYQEIEKLAIERGDKRLELTAVMGQTALYITPTAVSDRNLGATCAERAVELAKIIGDQAAQIQISWNLVNLFASRDEMEKAFATGENALTLAEKHGANKEEAYIANDLSRHYEFVGNLQRAEELARRARRLWRKLNNLPMLTDSLARSSSVACESGYFKRAIAFSNEGVQIGSSMNNLQAQAHNLLVAGAPHLYMGRIDNALAALTTGLRYARQINFTPVQIHILTYLTLTYIRCGDVKRGAAAAEAACKLAKTEFPRALIAGLSVQVLVQTLSGNAAAAKKAILEAKADSGYTAQALFSHRVMEAEALLALQEGDAQSALAVSNLFQTTMEKFGNLANMPMALLLKSKALAALGRWDEARQAVEVGMQTAVSTNNRYLHWQLVAFQSRLQTQQGNHEEAEALRRQAETIVNEIAANCPPDLQETFLSMPEVTAVLHPQQP